MTNQPRPPVVDEYLAELERAAERLPHDRRQELLADLTAHVDAGTTESESEADLRNMLDALGTPADIVAASLPDQIVQPDTVPTGRLALTFGILALVLVPLPLLGLFSIPMGITAILLGLRARGRLRSAGLSTSPATAGVVAGSLAILIPALLITFTFLGRTGNTPEPAPPTPTPVFGTDNNRLRTRMPYKGGSRSWRPYLACKPAALTVAHRFGRVSHIAGLEQVLLRAVRPALSLAGIRRRCASRLGERPPADRATAERRRRSRQRLLVRQVVTRRTARSRSS